MSLLMYTPPHDGNIKPSSDGKMMAHARLIAEALGHIAGPWSLSAQALLEEREANARLIAEAPELYEAAVEILACSWVSHDQRLIDGMKRLRAAVNRVNGETE